MKADISTRLKPGGDKRRSAKRPLALLLAGVFCLLASARVAAQGSFTLFVANALNYGNVNQRYYTIEKFDALGNASVFATNSSFTNPILSSPVGIALDSSGNAYVGCTQDGTWIEKFNPSGQDACAQFVNPTVPYPEGMVFDGAGTLYVANYYAGIEVYSPAGVGGVFATTSGTAGITGLAFDRAGNLYASGNSNGVIYRCDTNGNLTMYASPGHGPFGLAFDNSGNLYVALSATGNVIKFDAQTNQTLFASLGSTTEPTGLAFDTAGNLYVAEYASNEIVKIDPLTNITVFSTNGLDGPISLVLQQATPTTIDAANHYSYGADFGWMDWHDNAANGANYGAVIGQYVCSGHVYSANAGWINLGSGNPVDGIYYQNNSAGDFGVNQDGLGNLRRYAYGANIGWLNFESNGAPKVNLLTGILSGNVWSANCGWISLSNAFAFVQTDYLSPGALDTNGLPIAWELSYFNHTGVDPNADPDHDGVSNLQEYLAGTSPVNGGDYLRITAESFAPGGVNGSLTWTSVASREYYLRKTANLTSPLWLDSGLGLIPPQGSTTTRAIADTNAPMRFYRVQAVMPLAP